MVTSILMNECLGLDMEFAQSTITSQFFTHLSCSSPTTFVAHDHYRSFPNLARSFEPSTRHFEEIDEQERLLSIFKLHGFQFASFHVLLPKFLCKSLFWIDVIAFLYSLKKEFNLLVFLRSFHMWKQRQCSKHTVGVFRNSCMLYLCWRRKVT